MPIFNTLLSLNLFSAIYYAFETVQFCSQINLHSLSQIMVHEHYIGIDENNVTEKDIK